MHEIHQDKGVAEICRESPTDCLDHPQASYSDRNKTPEGYRASLCRRYASALQEVDASSIHAGLRADLALKKTKPSSSLC